MRNIANVSAQPFRAPYQRAWTIIGAMIGLLTIMWVINLMGGLGLNIFLTIFGGAAIWYFGISPIMNAYAIGAGGLWSLISWKSPKAGIADSLHTLYSGVLVGFFVFLVSGIVLSTVYFANNPMAFWALALIIIALIVAGRIFDMKGKTAMAVTTVAALLLFATSWIFNVSIALPGNQDAKAAELASDVRDGLSNISLWSSCSEDPIVVEDGARLTVAKDCPVFIDQSRIPNQDVVGVDFVLVDPTLRAQTGNLQLVSFSQGDRSNIVQLIPNKEGFERINRESVEIEIYPAGTGARRVAERHGTVSAASIDLRP